jgi:uncharacterized protein GlcG (DUF336 family)
MDFPDIILASGRSCTKVESSVSTEVPLLALIFHTAQLTETPMVNRNWISLLVPLCLWPYAALAQPQALITERNISLDAAHDAAVGTLEQCRKDGLRVTVTVLDRNGSTRAVLHDNGASPHTIENSLRKAYTALTFRQPSGDAGKRFTSDPANAGFLYLDKVTTLAGGLPIRAGNEVVGAIGVSGAPKGEQDAVCSQAGIDRIAKALGAV